MLLIVSGILLSVGISALLTARAGLYPNVLISITDANGGFYNGLAMIDPVSGKILGTLAADLPQLAGCSAAHNKPYFTDIAYDSGRRIAFAAVSPCNGGTLASNQVLARFDVASFRYIGLVAGPGPGSRLLANPARGQLLALSANGLRLHIINTSDGRLLGEQTFAPGETVTRWALDGGSNALLATQNGKLFRLDLTSFARTDLAQTGLDISLQGNVPDGLRAVVAGSTVYLLAKQNGQPVLASINYLGQLATYPLANQPMSLTLNAGADHAFIVTGCPSGTGCTEPLNRLYAFNTTTKQFERAGQSTFVAIQTLANQVRYSADGKQLLFDGVVTGTTGVGQRFVFSLDASSISPNAARVAIPGPRWESASLSLPDAAPGQGTVPVPPNVPAGGGIGGGGIAPTPVPIDEIERLLGMPLSMFDWSKITDDQIRAFGYDPAMVRRYIAQYKLQLSQYGQALDSQLSCAGAIAGLPPEQLQKIQAAVGVPLNQIDISKVNDEQIRSFGLDPAAVRTYYQQQKILEGGDACANVYTQPAFVAPYNSALNQVGATASNLTVQPVFDILAGGWLMELRWQAPGGAQYFHIFGRDTRRNQRERKLATVSSLGRVVRFGGFGRLGLPPWHDETYVLAVVPQQTDGTLGVPSAVSVRTRCYILFCTISPSKQQ